MNAWVGGFQSILKRMTVVNFNWFLHAMLFLHTERVIKKQLDKQRRREAIDDSDSDDEAESDMED